MDSRQERLLQCGGEKWQQSMEVYAAGHDRGALLEVRTGGRTFSAAGRRLKTDVTGLRQPRGQEGSEIEHEDVTRGSRTVLLKPRQRTAVVAWTECDPNGMGDCRRRETFGTSCGPDTRTGARADWTGGWIVVRAGCL